ncbi:MAG TPA: hypothetical protein VMZ33_04340 [Candidatus Limnocylindrales bacterium]|nr:hypothetical protein [Candidatus Limnocylindrales bacterium]
MEDQQAVERYRYMLRTAPPDDIERAHAEAFAQLSPDQRRQLLQGLSQQVPPTEIPTSDDPQSLARMATRAEMRQPGTMERTFGGYGGPGLGGMFFSTLAGAFIGTAIAGAFLSDHGDGASGDANAGDQGAESPGDYTGDTGDSGGIADSGDSGGDFGGGDFGDFGGGDIGF